MEKSPEENPVKKIKKNITIEHLNVVLKEKA